MHVNFPHHVSASVDEQEDEEEKWKASDDEDVFLIKIYELLVQFSFQQKRTTSFESAETVAVGVALTDFRVFMKRTIVRDWFSVIMWTFEYF